MERQAVGGSVANATREVLCFECDKPTRTKWCEHTFTYGLGDDAADLTVEIPVRTCASCGFEFLEHEAETLKHEAVCAHLGVLSPKEICGIQAMYRMSRAKFSRVTGLGEATLNRWEKAILIQNTANDRYLRLVASPENMRRLMRLDSSAARLAPAGAGRFHVETSQELRQYQATFSLRKVA